MKTKTRSKKSAARVKIEKFAAMIGVKFTSLEWEPIGRGGEMQGPSGGWQGQFAALDPMDSELEGDFYGYNADEAIRSLLFSVKQHVTDDARKAHFKLGVRDAAKEKDAEIADLKRRLATGDRADAVVAVNEIKAEAIRDLMRAIWNSMYGEPPMNMNGVTQEILDRHLGERWRDERLFEAPTKALVFESLSKADRKQFYSR